MNGYYPMGPAAGLGGWYREGVGGGRLTSRMPVDRPAARL